MPCRITGPTCEGFSDGSGSFWGWVGIVQSAQPGADYVCGCELNCVPCNDEPVMLIGFGAQTRGNRWLGPGVVGGRIQKMSDGSPARIKSKLIGRMAWQTTFSRATCYDHLGGECYNQDLCECDNPPDCSAETGPPGSGGMGNDPCIGFFPDSWFYLGSTWSRLTNPDDLDCRETTETRDKNLRVNAGYLYNDAYIRSGGLRTGGTLAHRDNCQSNRLIGCAAFIESGTSDLCAGGWNPDPGQERYNALANEGMWRNVAMHYNNVRLKDHGEGNPLHGATLTVKNLALDAITSMPSLGVLIHDLDEFRNDFLDRWRKEWQETASDQYHVATLNNCRLRFAGCAVRVEIYLASASVEMSLVAHVESSPAVPLDNVQTLRPSSTMRIKGKLISRAFITGTCENPPLIQNPQPGEQSLAVVVGDEIIYADAEGNEIEFPNWVEWWGKYGPSGTGPWNPLFTGIFHEQIEIHCCYLRYLLSGIRMYGWPTAISRLPQPVSNDIYNGHCEISFVELGDFGCLPPDDPGGGGGNQVPGDGDFTPGGGVGGIEFGPGGPPQGPQQPPPFRPTKPPSGIEFEPAPPIEGPYEPPFPPSGPPSDRPRRPIGDDLDPELPPDQLEPQSPVFPPAPRPVGKTPPTDFPIPPRLPRPRIPPTRPLPPPRNRPVIQGPPRVRPPVDDGPRPGRNVTTPAGPASPGQNPNQVPGGPVKYL